MSDAVLNKRRGPGSRIAPKLGRPYTEAEIRTSLETLASCAGNAERAATQLNAAGIPVTAASLGTWRKSEYADAYMTHRIAAQPRIDAETAEMLREVQQLAATATIEAITEARDKIPGAPLKDLSAAARNFSVTNAVAIDKTALIEGRPTSITEKRTGSEVLKTLQEMGRSKGFIEGTAVEVDESSTRPLARPSETTA